MNPQQIAKRAAALRAFEKGFKQQKAAFLRSDITLEEFIKAHKTYFKLLKGKLK